MRPGSGVVAAVLAMLIAGTGRAPAQESETRYWPLREINFPVPVDKIQGMNPRPTKLRFHVSRDRAPFERAAERTLADLDPIDGNRKGFRYVSPADGEYSFALQFVYADGDVNPRDSDLTAQYRVVFDTRPPLIRVAVTGTSGIEWEVQDDNPRPDSVELQVRWLGQPNFTTVSPRSFSLRDRYTWRDLTPSQPLEVRVVARDRAGHEGASRPVTLPATSAGSGLERDPLTRPGARPTGSNLPPTEPDYPSRPAIDYINSKSLTIESKLTRVTRSGVRAAHLWVNDGKGNWKLAKSQTLGITATSPDQTIRIPFAAEKDGLYGFIVIPENGAGGKQEDPRPGDPAQFLIEVDTERPHVKIKSVKVGPGGATGPRVEIEWEAVDKNLMPEPIVLEYAEEKTATEWKPITAGRVANSGRYIWEVEDKNLWRFFLRISAVDKATNRTEHIYDREVMIDLEKPAATIEKIQGSGNPPPAHQSERPSSSPPLPTQEPAPSSPSAPPTREPAPAVPAPVTPTPKSTSPVTPPPVSPSPGEGPPIPTLPELPKKR